MIEVRALLATCSRTRSRGWILPRKGCCGFWGFSRGFESALGGRPDEGHPRSWKENGLRDLRVRSLLCS